MIALCAMLYVQKRPPDTVILSSSPYSFDTKVTDYLSAASGDADVQTADARMNTFWAISKKLDEADDVAADAAREVDVQLRRPILERQAPGEIEEGALVGAGDETEVCGTSGGNGGDP